MPADAKSLGKGHLDSTPEDVQKLIGVVRQVLDCRGFAWVRCYFFDAAAKAGSWKTDFGLRQVVPTAVLSGVYKLHNLLDAQERGLTLFWAHDLTPLTEWIDRTKN